MFYVNLICDPVSGTWRPYPSVVSADMESIVAPLKRPDHQGLRGPLQLRNFGGGVEGIGKGPCFLSHCLAALRETGQGAQCAGCLQGVGQAGQGHCRELTGGCSHTGAVRKAEERKNKGSLLSTVRCIFVSKSGLVLSGVPTRSNLSPGERRAEGPAMNSSTLSLQGNNARGMPRAGDGAFSLKQCAPVEVLHIVVRKQRGAPPACPHAQPEGRDWSPAPRVRFRSLASDAAHQPAVRPVALSRTVVPSLAHVVVPLPEGQGPQGLLEPASPVLSLPREGQYSTVHHTTVAQLLILNYSQRPSLHRGTQAACGPVTMDSRVSYIGEMQLVPASQAPGHVMHTIAGPCLGALAC